MAAAPAFEEAQQSTTGLTRVLARALRTLGEVGHPGEASRFAAQGWVLLRHDHRAEAERLEGVLHYLARLPGFDTDIVTTRSAQGQTVDLKETAMAKDDQQLDVREEVPARRHELIFETYFGMSVGEAFVLVNDHDPKPLYYQFAAEHPGEFTWEALEEGPQVWRVRIGRTAAEDAQPVPTAAGA